jgi:arylsulfatase A-like enzyme
MRRAAYVLVFLWGLSIWAQAPDVWRARRVIVIGVDGLSVDGVSKAHVPRLKELMEHSAWTLSARAVLPTLSSPSWESIITGAGTEQHGIISNGHLRKLVEFEPACRDERGMFPTIFGLLRAAQPSAKIAVFHDWESFADLLEKSAPDVLQHEHGPEKTTAAAIHYWRENHPALLFIHLDNVDHTGHDYSWTSSEYYRAVTEADKQIGAVVDMVMEASAEDSTFILIVSDHGGKGRSHGGSSMAEILVPWVLSGPDIAPGQITAPVYAYDTAATLDWIFDLAPPVCAIGRPVISVFRPAAVALRNASRSVGEHGRPAVQPAVTGGAPMSLAPQGPTIGHSPVSPHR